jgi:hypothetical protein
MMIINENEVLECINDKSKRIILLQKLKGILSELSSIFQEDVYEYVDIINPKGLSLNKAAELEGKVIRLLLNALDIHPLVNLETLGYQEVDVDSISYSFIPKGKKVNGYTVVLLVIFFKYTENEIKLNTTLPFYYVSNDQTEFLLKMEERLEENIIIS